MITNAERLKCPSNNSCKHILMCTSDTDSYKTERMVNEFKLEIFHSILFCCFVELGIFKFYKAVKFLNFKKPLYF